MERNSATDCSAPIFKAFPYALSTRTGRKYKWLIQNQSLSFLWLLAGSLLQLRLLLQWQMNLVDQAVFQAARIRLPTGHRRGLSAKNVKLQRSAQNVQRPHVLQALALLRLVPPALAKRLRVQRVRVPQTHVLLQLVPPLLVNLQDVQLLAAAL